MTGMPHPFFQSPQDLPDEKSKHRQACEKVSQEALSGALAQMPSNDLAPTLKLESKPGAPVSAAESFSSLWFGGENSSASSAFDNIGVTPHHQGIASQPSNLPFETAQSLPPQLPGGFFPQQTLHDFFLPPAEETAREIKPVALNVAAYSSEVLSEGGEANYIGDETFEQLSTASASFSNVGDLSMTFGNSCLRCRKLNDPSSAFCNRCGLQLTHGIGYTPPVESSSLTLQDHPIRPSLELASGTPQASYPVQHQSHTMPAVPTFASPQDSTSQMATEPRPLMSSGPLVSFALPTQPISRPVHAMSSVPYASQQFQLPSWPRTELQDQKKYTTLLEVPEASIPATISSPELPRKRRAHPIFCFGFGGQVLVSFPLRQMRYAIHQPIGTGSAHFRPGLLYRCNVKDLPNIKTRLIDPVLDSHSGLPIEEKYVKVKDVVKTLEDMISRSSASPNVNPTQTMLLTLLALILKQRGGLKAIPEETLSRLLLSEEASTVQDFGRMASNPPDPSPGVVAEVTKSLSKGNRSDAVSVAVSHRMWDVALMIASHVDRETYCATVNEFARRSFPIAHPLRTLFLLFAGQGALAGIAGTLHLIFTFL